MEDFSFSTTAERQDWSEISLTRDCCDESCDRSDTCQSICGSFDLLCIDELFVIFEFCSLFDLICRFGLLNKYFSDLVNDRWTKYSGYESKRIKQIIKNHCNSRWKYWDINIGTGNTNNNNNHNTSIGNLNKEIVGRLSIQHKPDCQHYIETPKALEQGQIQLPQLPQSRSRMEQAEELEKGEHVNQIPVLTSPQSPQLVANGLKCPLLTQSPSCSSSSSSPCSSSCCSQSSQLSCTSILEQESPKSQQFALQSVSQAQSQTKFKLKSKSRSFLKKLKNFDINVEYYRIKSYNLFQKFVNSNKNGNGLCCKYSNNKNNNTTNCNLNDSKATNNELSKNGIFMENTNSILLTGTSNSGKTLLRKQFDYILYDMNGTNCNGNSYTNNCSLSHNRNKNSSSNSNSKPNNNNHESNGDSNNWWFLEESYVKTSIIQFIVWEMRNFISQVHSHVKNTATNSSDHRNRRTEDSNNEIGSDSNTSDDTTTDNENENENSSNDNNNKNNLNHNENRMNMTTNNESSFCSNSISVDVGSVALSSGALTSTACINKLSRSTSMTSMTSMTNMMSTLADTWVDGNRNGSRMRRGEKNVLLNFDFDEETMESLNVIENLVSTGWDESNLFSLFTSDMLIHFERLWSNETVKKAWIKHKRCGYPHNAEYFFDNLRKFVNESDIENDENDDKNNENRNDKKNGKNDDKNEENELRKEKFEIDRSDYNKLHFYTCGIYPTCTSLNWQSFRHYCNIQRNIEINSNEISNCDCVTNWEIIDSGGTKSERRKLRGIIPHAQCIVHCVSLMSFSHVLWEDWTENGLFDSLRLFDKFMTDNYSSHMGNSNRNRNRNRSSTSTRRYRNSDSNISGLNTRIRNVNNKNRDKFSRRNTISAITSVTSSVSVSGNIATNTVRKKPFIVVFTKKDLLMDLYKNCSKKENRKCFGQYSINDYLLKMFENIPLANKYFDNFELIKLLENKENVNLDNINQIIDFIVEKYKIVFKFRAPKHLNVSFIVIDSLLNDQDAHALIEEICTIAQVHSYD